MPLLNEKKELKIFQLLYLLKKFYLNLNKGLQVS